MSFEEIDLTLFVNGDRIERTAIRADMLLLDFLHEDLGLTGTKFSCGIGACGACKVALQEAEDGPMMPVLACFARLKSINGTRITTVEGLADSSGAPNPLQQAFLDEHAFQCGWSTPGFLIAGTVLMDHLAREPVPRAELDRTILEAVGGNVCRCTGYFRYFGAIRKVVLDTPALVVDDPPAPAGAASPTITFSLTKQSGNDLRGKLFVGRFDAPGGGVAFDRGFDLDTCRAHVDASVASLRTGVRVRDLNLRRFFFGGDQRIRFELTEATLVDRRMALDVVPWGTPVPAEVRGRLSFAGASIDVEHSVVIRVLAADRVRITSRTPFDFHIRKLGFPIEAFAAEFGLALSRDVSVTVDLELPYTTA